MCHPKNPHSPPLGKILWSPLVFSALYCIYSYSMLDQWRLYKFIELTHNDGEDCELGTKSLGIDF